MYKKILLLLAAILLLPGNIYLVYNYFSSASAKKTGFEVEGDKNNFLCRWGSNAASVIVDNNNITAVGAAAPDSDFYWAAIGNLFMLNYNNCMVIDYNRDFIADYISMPEERKYIQINGKLIPIASSNLKTSSVTLPNGKILTWQKDHWQEISKKTQR